METRFKHPFGPDLELHRYPKSEFLQAFDTSDSLLLEELSSRTDLKEKKILILNDSFGALALALKNFQVDSYSDSYVSHKGAKLNGLLGPIYNDLKNINHTYDLIILKLPKSHAFLEDLLCFCTQVLKPQSEIIVGSMVKHLAKSVFELIEKYIGPTRTSLAKKKARLIFSQFTLGVSQSSYPKEVMIPEIERKLIHYSNLFSVHKLDIGTRFFLEHIPKGEFNKILDLGCANGIVGIKAKILNPKAIITFCDDSFMALKSANENYVSSFGKEPSCHWTNCYEDGPESTFDLVLCNPPFHQNHTVGDFIALQMFQDAHRCLKQGATLRVIGNHHLLYHKKLKRIFQYVEIYKKNQKFMIIDAIK